MHFRKKGDGTFSCPNVSLFRLIGSAFGKIDSKYVLEVGFGHGADILECKRRGGIVYGLDLNDLYAENLCDISKERLGKFTAGVDKIPFNIDFDLIFSHDMIYYLDDYQIGFFFQDCYSNLKSNGCLIVQFIETDLIFETSKIQDDFSTDFFQNCCEHKIFPEDNPIRFLLTSNLVSTALNCGFRHIGSKRIIQSYDLHELEFRVDKYLVFSK